MSSATNEFGEKTKISKVSISQASPETLVVKIRKFSTEVKTEDLPRVSSDFKSIVSGTDITKNDEQLRSVMADTSKKSKPSKNVKKHRQRSTRSETENEGESQPCLKHAAENISRKASEIPAEKINLCSNCSKSMLSYIFVVQDFLDSLAKEIVGDSNSSCLQCAREEARKVIASESGDSSKREDKSSTPETQNRHNRSDGPGKQAGDKRARKTGSHRHELENIAAYENRPVTQGNPQFVYHVSSPDVYSPGNASIPSLDHGHRHPDHDRHVPQGDVQHNVECLDAARAVVPYEVVSQQSSDGQNLRDVATASSEQATDSIRHSSREQGSDDQNANQWRNGDAHYPRHESHSEDKTDSDERAFVNIHSENVLSHPMEDQPSKPVFHSPMERVQPHYDAVPTSHPGHHNDHNNNFPTHHSPSLYSDNLDGIMSTLSTIEREVYDTARNRAGWEGFTETPERLEPSSHIIASEAYVTSCRNNAEAIGCLVVGTSLLLCRTSRTLCVLVSDGVSMAFRGAFSAVFQVVQNVRSLDSLGTTKLALLEQPDLGVTFEKLNVWRLTQFSKCVYLNPDTLVVQNCDELFNHDELSAVPDIGWPDCFNSGVFVFKPSIHTFWALMEHADKQGSYDGGDQGLLNSYFSSWSSDINKKLSFIYNLMANVSYTYTPAFKQFGRSVKVVQFHGSFKPWHVKFFTESGQVSPSSPVHPTYVQFVHIWLNIFRISVLRCMSREIQSYAASQETICAVEILRFFPLPTESEAEFFLTPPSVRIRRAEKKLQRPSRLDLSEAQRRKSAEYSRYISPDDSTAQDASESTQIMGNQTAGTANKEEQVAETISESKADEPEEESSDVRSEGPSQEDEVFIGSDVAERGKAKGENSLPGAEIGDYQGMKAWEQGRMDYEGTDRSDNVLKRLQFLMSRPK